MNGRNWGVVILLVGMIGILVGCGSKKDHKRGKETSQMEKIDEMNPSQHMVEGVIVEVPMNALVLRTMQGDTVWLSTMDANPEKVPAVKVADSVKVVYTDHRWEGKEVKKVKTLTLFPRK